MNNNIDLKKLINNLKENISELKKSKNDKAKFLFFKIVLPLSTDTNKKYLALLFNNEIHGKEIDSNKNIMCICLKKRYNIINYCLTLKTNEFNKNCSFALAIKENNKIKIIKGSKMNYCFSKKIDDKEITLNNTLIYNSEKNEELCLIGTVLNDIELISEKSFIKILCL
jgi:hypothetical protein